MFQSEYSAAVRNAIDDVVSSAGLASVSALARRLDISRQTIGKWRATGLVPTQRALQMELISKGKVSWQRLCPDIVDDFQQNQQVINVYEARLKR